jgi:hypothetical protein
VFNDPVDPKRDTTAAIGPAIDIWTKVGRARVTAKSTGQYLYFKTYDNQRSWNTSNDVHVELPLVRFKPFVGGTYVDTRERPGYEIDSRARRRDTGVRVGGEWRLSKKTRLVARADALRLEFDDEEAFLGANLANALNRSSHTEQLQLKTALTPLTTFVASVDAIQDRFALNSLRDADSIRVMSGFELKPFTLISGTVFVGVRRFNALDASVPDFTGVVASVDARYAVRRTQFTLKVARDITYSFEIEQPYYVLTDTGVGVTQRITAVWDVVARVGRQSLSYRNVQTEPGLALRTDHAVMYGGGFGYRFGESLRFGIDVNNYRRTAPAAELRSFSGLRAGASVSYGFPQ